MAAIVAYGSSIADGTLTTACDMAQNATGGTETSKTTTIGSTSGVYGEVLSQGGTGSGVSSIPATPTGHGWLFKPGAGSFANAAWGAVVTFAGNGLGTADLTIRFFKYDGSSTYTSIGTINKTGVVSTKTTYTFTNTTMPAVTTLSTDYIYIDLWLHDTSTVQTDNPVIYVSNSATAGVANDMQITTASFTTGGGGGTTHRIICDGFGGIFV
jgi:hypothetical protein